ncbi:hypothetical protein CsSME_00006232 [Camellia sinensis var. sinensis]
MEKLTLAQPQDPMSSYGVFVHYDTSMITGCLDGEFIMDPLAICGNSLGARFSSFRRTKNFPWQRDLFEDSLRAAGLNGVENGTKLYISNLDIGVTNEDIKELFSEIGQLKRYTVHYDKNGRPSVSVQS